MNTSGYCQIADKFKGASISVTVSLGIAPAAPVNEPEAAITLADNALYKAKREGRNRSVFSS